MQDIWLMTIDDVLEAQALARSRGVKPGESYLKEVMEVMKKKGIKPIGVTELSKEELLATEADKGKVIADITHDKQGIEKTRIIKKKRDGEKNV